MPKFSIFVMCFISINLLFALGNKEQIPRKKNNLLALKQCEFNLSSKQKKLRVYMAQSEMEKIIGLSNLESKELGKDLGMLFLYPHKGLKSFWMPETNFDLDIFFLDENSKIIKIVRRLPHFPFKKPVKSIPKTESIFSLNVLEIRSGDPISNLLKEGDYLGPCNLLAKY